MTNRWKSVLVVLLLGMAGLAVPGMAASGAPASAAGDLLRKAYEAVVNAELAHFDHNETEAVASYRTALALYSRIQAEYPGWQAAMVSYRVAECQNEMAAIEQATRAQGSGTNPVAAATATATAGSNAVPRLESLLVELREARAALAAQPDKTGVNSTKELEQDRDHYRDEYDLTIKSNTELLRKIAKLEAKLNRAGLTDGTNTQCRAVAAAVKAESRRLIEHSELARAIDLLREGAELMPSETGLVVDLAVAFCRAGRFGDAVTVLKPFDVKHSVSDDALMTLGTAYMGLGKIGDARIATEKALKINPKSAEVNYNMAQILLSLMVPEAVEAQQYYRAALELGLAPDPDFENTLRTALIVAKLKKHGKEYRRTVDRGAEQALPLPFKK